MEIQMKSKWMIAAAAVALLGGCGHTAQKLAAQEPTPDTACALDGMVLKDFAGPKAQVHYTEGQPDFFCDLTELFGVVLAPEHKRAVAAIFVQDMGKTEWEHPQANWIDAKSAVYVVGSRKRGSMGPTFGSFSSTEGAEAFIKKEGGRIVRFEQVTPDMVKIGSVARDDMMSH
jgi:copper chaperone NosL